MAKVSFDIITRTIQILGPPVIEGNESIIDIDVKVDLYSDGKEAWLASSTLRKLNFPIRSVGGDALPGNRALGATFFLRSDWKILPYEGNHRLRVNGNFYSEDGTSPFLATMGAYNVFLEQTVSSLVDSTIVQLTAIEAATYMGVIHLDQANGYSKLTMPSDAIPGTERYPFNNWDDAQTESVMRSVSAFSVKGTFTFIDSDLSGYTIIGDNPLTSVIVLSGTGNVTNSTLFKDMILTGRVNGPILANSVAVQTLSNVGSTVFPTVFRDCIFRADVGATPMIQLNNSVSDIKNIHFIDCVSGVPGQLTSTIDVNNSDAEFAVRRYGGGLTIKNFTQGQEATVEIGEGQLKVDSSNTNGTLQFRGAGKLTQDDSGPGFIVTQTANIVALLEQILAAGGALTPTQEQLLIDLHKTFGLNQAHPVTHTESGFSVDDINVSFTGNGKDIRIATRQ